LVNGKLSNVINHQTDLIDTGDLNFHQYWC